MKSINKNTLLGVLLIALAVVFRMISTEMSWFNVAPLVGISLFSGFLFKKSRFSFLIPLGIFFLSDLYLQIIHGTGFYGISQFFVYGSMILITLLGGSIERVKPLRIAGYAMGGSLIFWIVSNLGVFAAGYYGYSFAGLVQTYLMAIPFYAPMSSELFFNAILGDVLFTSVIFAVYSLMTANSSEKALKDA